MPPTGTRCQLSRRTRPLSIVARPHTVVERTWLRVSITGVAALSCERSANVTIRDTRIEHAQDGIGIKFDRCHGIRLENVSISAIAAHGAALQRPNRCNQPYNDCDSILGISSADVLIDSVRLTGASSGVELQSCPRASVRRLVGTNFLGPYPRGQCVQFSESHGAVLDQFACHNEPQHSWTEDLISVWRSAGVVVRNGLVDGSNSPTGVCVMFENDHAHANGGAIENVDCVRQGNGCFSAYPATYLVMLRTRCGWNTCSGVGGRAPPASGGLMWAAGYPIPNEWEGNDTSDHGGYRAHGVVVQESEYWAACNTTRAAQHWARDADAYSVVDIRERHFKPRKPLELRFCWDKRLPQHTRLRSGGQVGDHVGGPGRARPGLFLRAGAKTRRMP